MKNRELFYIVVGGVVAVFFALHIYNRGFIYGEVIGFFKGVESQYAIDNFTHRFVGCGIRSSESAFHYTLECQSSNFTRKLFYVDSKLVFDVEQERLVNLTLNDLLGGKYHESAGSH